MKWWKKGLLEAAVAVAVVATVTPVVNYWFGGWRMLVIRATMGAEWLPGWVKDLLWGWT